MGDPATHRIFAERLPVAGPYAQRTARLGNLHHHIGLSLGGKTGARLAERIGTPVSGEKSVWVGGIHQNTHADRLVRANGACRCLRMHSIGIAGQRHELVGRRVLQKQIQRLRGVPRLALGRSYLFRVADSLIARRVELRVDGTVILHANDWDGAPEAMRRSEFDKLDLIGEVLFVLVPLVRLG